MKSCCFFGTSFSPATGFGAGKLLYACERPLIIFLWLFLLQGSLVWGQDEPFRGVPRPAIGAYGGYDEPLRGSLDVPAKLRELTIHGESLVQAIRSKDIKTIMKFIHDGGVAIGADSGLSRQATEHQVRTRKGIFYATLFDTQQLRRLYAGVKVGTMETHGLVDLGKVIRSMHDHFLKAKKVDVAAKDLMSDLSEKEVLSQVPLWGKLIFRWDERPHAGVYEDPVFIYTHKGWKFVEFFNVP